jgi:hypothetical protein
MIKINVKVEMQKFLDKMNVARDQIPFATALALTKTAQGVRQDLKAAMQKSFSHMSAFTANSLYITTADKRRLADGATIGVKEAAAGYLRPEIFGGSRGPGIEKWLAAIGLPPSGYFAVPTENAKFVGGGKGRVSTAWLQKICQQLGAGKSEGKKRKNQTQIFALTAKKGRLVPGIYSQRGGTVTPLILFVPSVKYGKRFDFFGVAEQSARRRFPQEFADAVKRAKG